MNREELYYGVIQRMKNFNISFKQAIKETKEIYPKYSDILDKFIEPNKTQITMSCELWKQFEKLMCLASDRYETTEEKIQRQLGLVEFLYDKEFNNGR
jgi:hypothetical protein